MAMDSEPSARDPLKFSLLLLEFAASEEQVMQKIGLLFGIYH